MPTLTLLRHAQTQAGSLAMEDHERALTETGLDDAKTLGADFAAQDKMFDLILCSTATRTRQTLDQLLIGMDNRVIETRYLGQLYHSSAERMAQLISETPEHIENVLVVGHNPGISELAGTLAQQCNSPPEGDAMLGLKPCDHASYNVANGWNFSSA